MPPVEASLWNRMVATLWTTIMAFLRRGAPDTAPYPVTAMESSMRDMFLEVPPASMVNPNRQQNLFLSTLMSAQRTGRAPWAARKLPREVCKRLRVPRGRGRGGPKKNIAWLCEKLERRTVRFKPSSCLKVVAAVRELISEMTCAEFAENRDAFLLLRGDTLLVKVLLITDRIGAEENGRAGRHADGERATLLQLQALGLQTLQDLCYAGRTCLEGLCWDDDLLIFLFKSMHAKELFSPALGLAEEMVGYRDKQLDLRAVPHFAELVASLSDEQLTVFCRLLTLTVSGPEDYRDPIEKVTDSSPVDWTKPPSRWSVVKPLTGDLEQVFLSAEDTASLSEHNHELLMELPGLLSRLVKLLGSKKINSDVTFSEFLTETLQPLLRTHPTIEQGAPPEVQTLIRLMRGGLTGARIAHGTGGANTLEIVVDPTAAAGDEAEGDAPEDVQREMQRTMEQQAWQYKVEILFMFCSMCEGREAVRVQDELARLGLVPVLKELFHSLDWSAAAPTGPQESHGLHGPGCECNPEMTMKVQLLKMVHSLCDRSGDNCANKALFVLPQTLPEEPSSPIGPFPGGTSKTSVSFARRVIAFDDATEENGAASVAEPSSWTLGAGFGESDVAGDDVADGDWTSDATRACVPEDGASASDVRASGEAWFPVGGFAAKPKSEEGSGVSDRRGSGKRTEEEASTSARGEEEGLIAGIVRTLMKQTAASSFRFWLASCIEVFMRGSDPRHQEYVARFGLMEHLVDQILKPGFQLSSEYQINFDLLSELVKFNPAMFARLNRLLDGPKFDRFMVVVTEHLVDTNVFIRSLVLSLQHFHHGTPAPPYLGANPTEQDAPGPSPSIPGSSNSGSDPNPRPGSDLNPTEPGAPSPLGGSYSASFHSRAAAADPSACKLEMFVACNTTRLLYDLMQAVDKDDVTQDNMCVVNTSLLFFLFARRKGQLAQLLARLRAREQGGARALRNFRSLLKYWKHYYLRQRGRDSRSIEYSTNVAFREWLQMVQILGGPEDDPLSLVFGIGGETIQAQD